MAISVVVAVEPVADDLIAKVTERMSTLKVGDGTRGCDMGPLITREHRDKVAGYLDVATADGAEIVVDGRGVEVDGEADGFWLGPTLVDKVPTSSKVYTDEIFGPVLSVVRVDSYEEGLALINASRYGNGTAIFTNDGGAARRFQREVTVGMVGINVPIPVPVGYFSFGGWKDSLFQPLARPEPRRHQPGLPAELTWTRCGPRSRDSRPRTREPSCASTSHLGGRYGAARGGWCRAESSGGLVPSASMRRARCSPPARCWW